jgi:hypothetical protein
VSLVANGGLCGSGTSSTLMVQNGSVRAGGSGVSVLTTHHFSKPPREVVGR